MNININNNINSLKADINHINDKVGSLQEENLATREELLARIDTKSRLSSRASSRALSSRYHAATLIIPVAMVPVLKTLPLCLSVPAIECSPIRVDPTLSVGSTSQS
jgi:hypothetical protein